MNSSSCTISDKACDFYNDPLTGPRDHIMALRFASGHYMSLWPVIRVIIQITMRYLLQNQNETKGIIFLNKKAKQCAWSCVAEVQLH